MQENTMSIDDRIVALLKARNGVGLPTFRIAAIFGLTSHSTRFTMDRLLATGRVHGKTGHSRRYFYVPTAAQLEETARTVEAARPFRAYQVPATIRRLTEQLQQRREAFPSYHTRLPGGIK